ncbi:hypothetical protein JXA80_11990 [bacterium]|nr:hypothetical protein [candidate division CSSED10-310 bacterium]
MKPACIRYPEDLLRYMRIWDNGMFMHASAVETPCGALVFLGPSNAGKTTLAHLLTADFPIIHEDCVYVFRESDGVFSVRSGQFHHEFLFRPENPRTMRWDGPGRGIPIAGIWRVFKAKRPALVETSRFFALRYMMSSVFEINIQHQTHCPDLELEWFRRVAEMERVIGLKEFQFSKNLSTVHYVTDRFRYREGDNHEYLFRLDNPRTIQ